MNEILIRKAKKGDKDAFCRLIDENVQSMYKVAAAYLKNDEDVADAIQDTIIFRCMGRLCWVSAATKAAAYACSSGTRPRAGFGVQRQKHDDQNDTREGDKVRRRVPAVKQR